MQERKHSPAARSAAIKAYVKDMSDELERKRAMVALVDVRTAHRAIYGRDPTEEEIKEAA